MSYRSSQQTSWKHGTSANGLKDGYIVFYSMGTLCFTAWVLCVLQDGYIVTDLLPVLVPSPG